MVVDDEDVDGVVDAIRRGGRDRQDRRRQALGHPVEHLVRLRTGEHGPDALR